jgi:hypothetical protein
VHGRIIPIFCRYILAKLHLKIRWDIISLLCRIQFSHVYESSSMPLLCSLSLVLSSSWSNNQKKNFCFDWHFDFQRFIKVWGAGSDRVSRLYAFCEEYWVPHQYTHFPYYHSNSVPRMMPLVVGIVGAPLAIEEDGTCLVAHYGRWLGGWYVYLLHMRIAPGVSLIES